MYIDYIGTLDLLMKFILASGSPRRKELLQTIGIHIDEVMPSKIEEKRKAKESPIVYCSRLACEKSHALPHKEGIILAADTIVTQGEAIFEKPNDDIDAIRILQTLSGTWHTVITAWSIYLPHRHEHVHGHCSAKVLFRKLTRTQILSYVHTQEGRDKAGAYGIQGKGAALISSIEGSYSNIVGLPMEDILPALHSFGIIPQEPS